MVVPIVVIAPVETAVAAGEVLWLLVIVAIFLMGMVVTARLVLVIVVVRAAIVAWGISVGACICSIVEVADGSLH